MDTKNILILVIGLLNIILGFVVLFKNPKNPANFWFFMLCFFGGGWGVMKAIQLSVLDIQMQDLWIARVMVFFGIMAPLAYLFLAYHFPYKLREFAQKTIYFIFSVTIIMVILTLVAVLTYFENSIVNNELHREVIFWEFLIFAIYYFVYVFSGLMLLVKKYKLAEGINKEQIKYLIIATIGTFVTVGFVSIILLLLNIFTYDWLGALFLLIFFSFAGYLIFIKPRLKY